MRSHSCKDSSGFPRARGHLRAIVNKLAVSVSLQALRAACLLLQRPLSLRSKSMPHAAYGAHHGGEHGAAELASAGQQSRLPQRALCAFLMAALCFILALRSRGMYPNGASRRRHLRTTTLCQLQWHTPRPASQNEAEYDSTNHDAVVLA